MNSTKSAGSACRRPPTPHPIPPHTIRQKGQGVIPRNLQLIIDTPAEQRSDQQKNELSAYYRTIASELQPVRQQILQIQQRIESYPRTSLVMQELPKPRESHIHIRGGFLTLGDKVVPGTPAVFNRDTGALSSGPRRRPSPRPALRCKTASTSPVGW